MRLIVNPAAGRGRGAAALPALRHLATGRRIQVEVSESPADLVAEARRAVEQGEERLIVAGGDGTFHLAIQGLAGSECALGLIPVGTGNDLPAIVGVPSELAEAFQVASEGSIRRVDLGIARLGQADEEPTSAASDDLLLDPLSFPAGRAFGIYCGVGFDGEVTLRAHGIRRLRGPLTYALATLATLTRFVPPHLTVAHDTGVFTGQAMFAVVANGDRLGGGMHLAPRARVDDGLLDLVIVERVSKATFLRIFPRVYRGRHLSHPAVRYLRTRRARLTAGGPTPATADGEPLGSVADSAELDVVVSPAALGVATP